MAPIEAIQNPVNRAPSTLTRNAGDVTFVSALTAYVYKRVSLSDPELAILFMLAIPIALAWVIQVGKNLAAQSTGRSAKFWQIIFGVKLVEPAP